MCGELLLFHRNTGQSCLIWFLGLLTAMESTVKSCIAICSDGVKSVTTGKKKLRPTCSVLLDVLLLTSTHFRCEKCRLIYRITEEGRTICLNRLRFVHCKVDFFTLCEETGANHTSPLLHAEVRLLSGGKVLTSLFVLRGEWLVCFELPEQSLLLARHTTFELSWHIEKVFRTSIENAAA
jgi:hypothetical protein